jgi:Holliday junction resolvase
MGINGNRKGKCWERDFSKILGETFGGEFRRVPQSGAFFGGQNRSRAVGVREDAKEILSGDIIVPQNFPFSIECKSYKELDFHRIIRGESKQLDGWIEQAEDDAKFSNKKMLLAIKIKNKGEFICLNCSEVVDLLVDNFMVYKKNYILIDMKTALQLLASKYK